MKNVFNKRTTNWALKRYDPKTVKYLFCFSVVEVFCKSNQFCVGVARLIAFYPPPEGFFTQKRSPSKPQIKSPHFGPPQNVKSLKIYNWQFEEKILQLLYLM